MADGKKSAGRNGPSGNARNGVNSFQGEESPSSGDVAPAGSEAPRSETTRAGGDEKAGALPAKGLTNASAAGGPAAGGGAASAERGQPRCGVRVGGEVEFDLGIISDIAIREASEVEGIAELTGGWRTRGVTVGESDEGEPGYVIDMRIAVEYGVDCVALAETIRSRIGNAVHQMTGRQAIAVNVHVTGIRESGREETLGKAGEELGEETGPLGEEHGIDF